MGLAINKEKLGRFAREFGLSAIVFYGSYAAGKANDESDIDVAIKFKMSPPEKTFHLYGQLLDGLEEVFNIKDKNIDLVFLDEANILLRYNIMRDGLLLFGDRSAFEQYCAFATRDYIDASALFDLEDHLIRQRQIALKQAI